MAVLLTIVSPGPGIEHGTYQTLNNYFLGDVWMGKWKNWNREELFSKAQRYLSSDASIYLLLGPAQEIPPSNHLGALLQIKGLTILLLPGKWQPTPVFLPGKSHEQRSLIRYSPQGHKESDMTQHCSSIILLEATGILPHHQH